MNLHRQYPARIRVLGSAGAFSVLSAFCPHVEAHLVTTGLGPIYDGIAHFALSPADLAVAVVLTLLAAMRGPQPGRWMVAILPLAWLLGSLVGMKFPLGGNLNWVMGISFLLAGVLVAVDCNFPVAAIGTLVGVIGTLHGIVSAPELARSPAPALELLGVLVALAIVITLIAGFVVSLQAFWARIVVRVMGSWIAATGLLLIGWSFRTGG